MCLTRQLVYSMLASKVAACTYLKIWWSLLCFGLSQARTDTRVTLQEAVRNLHLEAREAVERARSSDEAHQTPLRAEELDRLSGMSRREAVASSTSMLLPERLAIDYRVISGLDAPTTSRFHRSSDDSYAPPDPRLVEQMELERSGTSTPNGAFPGEEEEFGVGSVVGAAGGSSQRQPYILDASWQDFVAQLGF
jgi:hypothetical protein